MSLEDPLVLVAGDPAFVLLALPALVVGRLLPCLVEVYYLFVCFCCYLQFINIITYKLREVAKVFAESAHASFKQCDFLRSPDFYKFNMLHNRRLPKGLSTLRGLISWSNVDNLNRFSSLTETVCWKKVPALTGSAPPFSDPCSPFWAEFSAVVVPLAKIVGPDFFT
jgi:hypothetical protein